MVNFWETYKTTGEILETPPALIGMGIAVGLFLGYIIWKAKR